MQYAEYLTSEQVERIHEVSVEILQNVGVLVRSPNARAVFKKCGCRVDEKTGLVKIPSLVVDNFIRAFVPGFTFRGRNPEFDKTIPDDAPVIVTASSAPDMVDPTTGRLRRANSTDMAQIAHLINELPGYDVFSTSVICNDAPEGQFSLARFYPALKNCLKPVRGNTPDLKDLKKILELGALVAGGEEAYQKRPLITHHCCACVSPLTLDVNSTESLIYLVEKGLPAYCTIVPNAGMTSPMTLVGTLAQANAEFLAVALLMQMVKPETPLIYAVLETVADMRTGAYAPGGIETGMLQMGAGQMARFYNVPSGGYVGLTNSHSNDAQTGFETGMNVTAAFLGGAHMLNMGGLISSLMAFDYGKAVVDGEIGSMLKRMKRGMEFSESNMALDVIAKVGPGGVFVDQDHTMEHMRSTGFLPRVASRQPRGQWEKEGRPDAHERAMKIAREIISGENPAVFGDETDEKIRKRFKRLIAENTPNLGNSP